MQSFETLSGPAAPVLRANIDTDVIIRIERLTGGDRASLGRYALEALRFKPDGEEDPDFILNQPGFREAPILLGGPNFGCGSSREGAVWALLGRGVRCVIADGFGDIFYSNCFQNGLLAIRLEEWRVLCLAKLAEAAEPMTIDLAAQEISIGAAKVVFEIDPRRKQALLEGLDEIDLSLSQMPALRDWQARDRIKRPWVWAPVAR